jgi:hypothetical protein
MGLEIFPRFVSKRSFQENAPGSDSPQSQSFSRQPATGSTAIIQKRTHNQKAGAKRCRHNQADDND